MISTSPSEHSVSTQNDDIESYKNENIRLKIFIGGLNYITLKDDLKCYFKTFGHVSKCIVIINEKGGSKCYGFVTFEDSGTSFLLTFVEEKIAKINEKLFSRKHEINGKIVDVKTWVDKKYYQNKAEENLMLNNFNYSGKCNWSSGLFANNSELLFYPSNNIFTYFNSNITNEIKAKTDDYLDSKNKYLNIYLKGKEKDQRRRK